MAKLRRLGFDISVSEVFSPAPAAVTVLRERGLRPHLLVYDGKPASSRRESRDGRISPRLSVILMIQNLFQSCPENPFCFVMVKHVKCLHSKTLHKSQFALMSTFLGICVVIVNKSR